MKVKPWNRRLLIERVEAKKEEKDHFSSQILVPDEFKIKTNDPVLARVKGVADDASEALNDKLVLVEPNGIEEVKVEGRKYYLVLENYVICTLQIWEDE
tara:strand:+ start:1016 stop:1312 length:297 start_codon:yes stop_codon:yes gene_type:complete